MCGVRLAAIRGMRTHFCSILPRPSLLLSFNVEGGAIAPPEVNDPSELERVPASQKTDAHAAPPDCTLAGLG
jgi:hypothetical protein